MRRLAAILIRSFLQGLLILSPVGITAYVIYKIFDGIDTIIPLPIRGLGFIIVISVVTIVGALGTRLFLGKILIEAFDHMLEHTPGIKYLYTSVKDIMDSFVGDKKRFNKPVWVCTNLNPELWRIGFLTQNEMAHLGMKDKVAVYLPHSYAISGWVIVVDPKYVKPVTRMNAGEAMKFAVSGGVANMEEDIKNKS